MKNYGFIKVAAAVPNVRVAGCTYNAAQAETLLKQAAKKGVRAVVFPELNLTGYTCGDLFTQPLLAAAAEKALGELLAHTAALDIVYMVGLPVAAGAALLNAAAVCYKGRLLGVVPKTYLPNNREFYEQRWFTSAADFGREEVDLCGQKVPAGTDILFETDGYKFGVEIGEDAEAVMPPSGIASLQGADIIFNLSASHALAGKQANLRQTLAQQSARCIGGYVYASCGMGESTTDVAFGGDAFIFENGTLLASSRPFSAAAQLITAEIDVQRLRTERMHNTSFRMDATLEQTAAYLPVFVGQATAPVKNLERFVSPTPFIEKADALDENCEEILNIQITALATRLLNANIKTVTVGISGGLDSTLALLVCAKAFDKLKWPRKNIIGVTMPGFGTTGRTYQNALSLMKALQVTQREVDIKASCRQHFKDIGHNESKKDVTYENAQARERTQILMDMANQTGGIVVGTGDLSELALGWATYNGDHMSMYGVNAGVPKTLVRSLVEWISRSGHNAKIAAILKDILATPISPELLPAAKGGKIAQKTEEAVGPYALHDFFLFYLLRYGFGPAKIFFLARHAFAGLFTAAEIKKWLVVFLRRFFTQQFKRSCMPDGPKVGAVGLSPRGDWRMPSDASYEEWVKEAENIKIQ